MRCHASPSNKKSNPGQAVAGAALAAILVAGIPTVSEVQPAQAGALVPCAKSKAFEKRKKNEVKALQKRLKLVCRFETNR